jgi:predicted metal-dependent peptidase
MPSSQLNSDLDSKSFDKEAEHKLNQTISKLIVFKPIFGLVFIYLNKIQSRSIPTMGVGVIRRVDLGLFYNPEFVLSLSNLELRAVLMHEALHILLHHIDRSIHFNYNKKGYNIAADMAINCHIPNLPPNGFYPSTFQFPDFQSSEWYYENLKKEAEKNNSHDFMSGKGQLIDDHGGWEECEGDILKEKIQNIAEKCISAQEEKGWSKIGTELAQAIVQANKSVLNWKREARWFINKVILTGRKSTRSRVNRREQALIPSRDESLKGVYIQPGAKRDFTSKLLIALDCSGSVSENELSAFIGEINGMISVGIECHVTMFDTKILCEPFQISKKVSGLDIKGRGGTDFDPIMRYVENHKYDGLIIMTDLGCPIPVPPKNNCRVLWCASPAGDSIPDPSYGKRIRVEIKNK